MTRKERDEILSELHAYAIEVRSLDLSEVVKGFKATNYACTHEIDRIAEKGYLTCKCGKNMKWPAND